MKKTTIKLNLKKSTVATLDDNQLKTLNGGTGGRGPIGYDGVPKTLGCSTPNFCF